MTTLAAVDLTAYIPVFVILLMAIAFVVATIIASLLFTPATLELHERLREWVKTVI